MANLNKSSFHKVKERPLKRGRTELYCKAWGLCSLSLSNADCSVHKQLTETKALNLSILRHPCQLCVGYRKCCCQIEAGVSSEPYEAVFQQVILLPFPFLSTALEEVVLRALETLTQCLHLCDLFCRCQKWTGHLRRRKAASATKIFIIWIKAGLN